MSTQFQLRRDTQANLAAAVPAPGEPAFDISRAALMIGDGASAGGVPLAPVALFGGYAPGRYYTGGAMSTATASLTANTLYLLPFLCLQKTSWTRMGVEIVTGGGANGRLGIYRLGAGAQGGSLLYDNGAVSVAAAGVQELSGLTLTLNPGAYGLAFLPDGNVALRACTGYGALANLLCGASASNIAAEGCATMAQSYGPLPPSFAASPSYLTAGFPSIWLRL